MNGCIVDATIQSKGSKKKVIALSVFEDVPLRGKDGTESFTCSRGSGEFLASLENPPTLPREPKLHSRFQISSCLKR